MANREVQWFPVYAIDAQNYLRGVRNYQVAVYLEDGSLAPFVYNEKGQQVSNPFSATIPGTYIAMDDGEYDVVFSTSGGIEFRRQRIQFLFFDGSINDLVVNNNLTVKNDTLVEGTLHVGEAISTADPAGTRDNLGLGPLSTLVGDDAADIEELPKNIGFFVSLTESPDSFAQNYSRYPIEIGYVVRVNSTTPSAEVIPSTWKCTATDAELPGGATPGELYEGKLYVENGSGGYYVFEIVGDERVDDAGEVRTLREDLAAGDAAVSFRPNLLSQAIRDIRDKFEEAVSVKDFVVDGVDIGDGLSHPLSEAFTTLEMAQLVYPHADSLDDELAWAAFQAALNTGRCVLVPDKGEYVCNRNLHMKSSGQVLYGLANGGSGSSIKFTDAVVGAGIELGTPAPSLSISGVGIRDLNINGEAIDGASISVNNCSRVDIERVTLARPYNGLEITDSNTVRLEKVSGVNVRGEYFIKWYGTSTTKCDILILNRVQCSPYDAGSDDRPTALLIDGFCHTLEVNGFRAIRMGRGLHVIDSYEVAGEIPKFGFINDFECDFSEYEAVRLEAGAAFFFIDSYAHGSQKSDGIYVGSSVAGFTWNGEYVTGHAQHGFNINCAEAFIRATVARNSVSSTGTYNGIEVGASASSVRIIGGASGKREGATGLQGYGVAIRNGAVNVSVIGNDLTGNVTGPLLDEAASGNTTVIANRGMSTSWVNGLAFDATLTTPAIYPKTSATQRALALRAIGNDYVQLGNGNGVSFLAGSSTLNVVNRWRAAGSQAGNGVVLVAEGDDTNIHGIIRGKGNRGVLLQDGSSNTRVAVDGTGIGFFGTTTAAKQTVTGSTDGNDALKSLITALAAYGLITDSTT